MTIVKSLPLQRVGKLHAFKKPTEVVVQANPYVAINFRQKIAAMPHKNLSIWKRSARPTFTASVL